jgi:type III restriction enzyme
LCAQLINHIKGYLKNDEDVRNVVLYNQRQLANFIYGEMQKNRNDSVSDFEVKITKGFTTLKEIAFTADANTKPTNYRETKFDKSKIGQIIFNGFSKCLYTTVKFDSDTERRFSVILEQESIKWFKPAQGQFQIYYQNGTESSEYVPDFVAETKDSIFMIETKVKNQINVEEVKAKKKAAQVWCGHASDHNAKNSGKPWKYLLIPHEEVKDNMTLKNFEQNYSN